MIDAVEHEDWLKRLNSAHKRLGAAQLALNAHASKGASMDQTGQKTDDTYWRDYGERLRAAGTRQTELESIYQERLSLPEGR